MLFAPLAQWAAIMATVSKNGSWVCCGELIVSMGGFCLSLAILWGILVVVGFIVIRPRPSHLLRLIREPLMIAFSTASSEAAYPKTLEGLTASVPRRSSPVSCCRWAIRSISTAR